MSEVKEENINLIINALKEYAQKNETQPTFNPPEFVNFMESKFFKAGYRYNEMPRPRSEHGNILVIHDKGVGDFILMSGALREIRRLHPAAKIRLLIDERAADMAKFCPYVNEIVTHDSGRSIPSNSFKEIYDWVAKFAAPLLSERWDICYSYTHFYATQLLMYMSGAKVRYAHMFTNDSAVGDTPFNLDKAINFLATNFAPPFLYGTHQADCYFSFLDAQMNLPIANRNLEVWCKREDIAEVKKKLYGSEEIIYALNMGGSKLCKHYPPGKYAKVVEKILENENATVVILGVGQVDLNSAKIFKYALPERYHKKIIDLTDKLSYRQSAALLTLCTAYIGNTTGLMHAASAIHLPVIAAYPFPADLPKNIFNITTAYSPYRVPSVVIQPARALPECAEQKIYTQYGCASDESHCIKQIEPEKFIQGLQILKAKFAKKDFTTSYIS